eukprot:comp24334_c8_seq1/m.46073 comp24334_c8_seq1/g.46073  ORF comp24334_c8_seq1/g.46073 comp24334_c8_seq1/m.46073 type:complete len:368 (+) comp24334_c8_seq1:1646-2749(+)
MASYPQYLGVPVDSVGVMFPHMVEKRVELARKRLAFFSANIFKDTPLHPSIRLTFIRTFVFPACEYGLPLLAAWIKKERTRALKPLANFLEAEVASFLSNNCCKPGPVTLSIYGLVPIAARVSYLALKFNKHISRLKKYLPSHPLFSIRPVPSSPLPSFLPSLSPSPLGTNTNKPRNSVCVTLDCHLLIKHVHNHKIITQYNKWKKIPHDTRPDESIHLEKLSLMSRFIYTDRLNHIAKYGTRKCITPKYILPSCRTGLSLADGIIDQLPRFYCTRAIQWRSNKYKVASFACPNNTHTHQFNRSCIAKCSLIDHIIPQHTHVTFTTDTQKDSLPVNYNILDFILNTRNYDLFIRCIDWLEKHITTKL